MKKVDVLIIYETRVRELENVCLLKIELEKRGLSVELINTWYATAFNKTAKVNARVVLTPSMYNDAIYDFVRSICGNAPKVVNLQWEQIGTVGDKTRAEARFALKGIAAQCVNICWGEKSAERLRNVSKIDEEHIRVTGQLTMDFCRPAFRNYYLSREELADRFGLPVDKSWNLFISSFSYVNLPENLKKESGITDKEKFIDFSVRSFNGIIDWFAAHMDKDKNCVVIYRPHPAEASNKRLSELVEQYKGRFFVISEMSVKQWIVVADRVYTWYSTSAAEAFAFDVPCAILRPYKMPEGMELELYEGSSFIESSEDFESSFVGELTSSVNSEVFSMYYSITGIPTYIRIADVVEEVLGSEKFLIGFKSKEKKKSLKLRVKSFIYGIVAFFARTIFYKCKSFSRFREKPVDEYTLARVKNNFADRKEISAIEKKINECIIGNKENI